MQKGLSQGPDPALVYQIYDMSLCLYGFSQALLSITSLTGQFLNVRNRLERERSPPSKVQHLVVPEVVGAQWISIGELHGSGEQCYGICLSSLFFSLSL